MEGIYTKINIYRGINEEIYTLVGLKSFQGPLFDRMHPPSLEQEQAPPRKSGISL